MIIRLPNVKRSLPQAVIRSSMIPVYDASARSILLYRVTSGDSKNSMSLIEYMTLSAEKVRNET